MTPRVLPLAIAAVLLGAGGAAAERGAGEGGDGPQAGAAVGDGQGGVRLKRIASFASPVHVAQPPGESDLLFVVEQRGRIMVVRNGDKLGRPFLDIRSKVKCCGEEGLLSVAFAPDYASSGRFYVHFTNTASDIRIQEFRRSAFSRSRADHASARTVLKVNHPFENHNGGLVLFGPDDRLYIGIGDGGGSGDPRNNGQRRTTLLGKILRIDPRRRGRKNYTTPGNPFRRGPGRNEIYAYGLRNPWRFSFDRRTGAMTIGDVGQDRFEELNYRKRGKAKGDNFGWAAFEGRSRFKSGLRARRHVKPIHTYGRGRGCSVTGGYVVRDRDLTSLYGRYLYGDYCDSSLFSFVPGRRRAKRDRPLGLRVSSLTSFAEDNDGHIYAVSHNGPVFRLLPK